NLDRVASQALEYGHSELREFSFLIVHSVLHLIGFDHMNESDRLLMEQKQRDIMNALGILRDDYK
ncbi:MAG: rRNA maturation RNase YbeY, partial [Lachnospiraceae bacterium]